MFATFSCQHKRLQLTGKSQDFICRIQRTSNIDASLILNLMESTCALSVMDIENSSYYRKW